MSKSRTWSASGRTASRICWTSQCSYHFHLASVPWWDSWEHSWWLQWPRTRQSSKSSEDNIDNLDILRLGKFWQRYRVLTVVKSRLMAIKAKRAMAKNRGTMLNQAKMKPRKSPEMKHSIRKRLAAFRDFDHLPDLYSTKVSDRGL